MIIAFKNKSLYNSYSKRPDKLLHQVTDYHIPLYKELGYPTTTLDKEKENISTMIMLENQTLTI